MEFYLYLNGGKRGPFNEEQVRACLAVGLLHASDLISDHRDSDLRAISTFEIFDAASPPLEKEPETAVPVAAPAPPAVTSAPAAAVESWAPLPIHSLGPYARSTLAPNETAFYKTSLHWIIFVRFALLGLLAFLFIAMPFAIAVQAVSGSELGWFALPLPVFLMLAPTLAYVSSELVITNIRVLIKTGIIRRQTLEMFIAKAESIAIDQGFFGRIFDYGTVIIRGMGGFEERFEAIARPIEFRNWVQRMQKGGEPARART